MSSWAKYRPCCCSVTCRPSISQPPCDPATLLSRSLVALPRTRTRPTTRAPVPREDLRPTLPSTTFLMCPICHHHPGLARSFGVSVENYGCRPEPPRDQDDYEYH